MLWAFYFFWLLRLKLIDVMQYFSFCVHTVSWKTSWDSNKSVLNFIWWGTITSGFLQYTPPFSHPKRSHSIKINWQQMACFHIICPFYLDQNLRTGVIVRIKDTDWDGSVVVVVVRSEMRVLWHKKRTWHLGLRVNHSTTDPYLACAFIFFYTPLHLCLCWICFSGPVIF